jgi:AcrR family transcriptional regulator
MAEAILDIGYKDLTVSDVVRIARVSKRTFYDYFDDKEDCLLALYDESTAHVIKKIELATNSIPPGLRRVRVGVTAYLTEMQSNPTMLHTSMIEILQAGRRGLDVRRATNRRYEKLLLREMVAIKATKSTRASIATALVGGLNELILVALEDNRTDRLVDLVEPVIALLHPFLTPKA